MPQLSPGLLNTAHKHAVPCRHAIMTRETKPGMLDSRPAGTLPQPLGRLPAAPSQAARGGTTHASAANECLNCTNANPRERLGLFTLRGMYECTTSPKLAKIFLRPSRSVKYCSQVEWR